MFTKAFKLQVTHKTIYIDEGSLNSIARPASFLVLSTIYSLGQPQINPQAQKEKA
jgi:hypothetical protein